MNRTIPVAAIAAILCTPIVTEAAMPGHDRATLAVVTSRRPAVKPKQVRAAAAVAPPAFLPIVRFQNLWNSRQHAFHIQVEDSSKRVFVFKITDPAEYAQVQAILNSANGATTDGESISAGPQAAAVTPE